MEVKYLLNVNEAILPSSIKKEFNKIRYEFRGGYNNTLTITPPFRDLYTFHIKGLLFENEDDEYYENIFVKLTNEKLSLFIKEYHKGFKSGYENNEYLNTDFNDNSNNKIKINSVFTEVYEKFNELKFYLPEIPKSYLQEFPNDGFLCIKLHFYELGVEVGTFIKCWDIILNNSYLFEEIFDKHYNQQPAYNESKDIEVKENIHPKPSDNEGKDIEAKENMHPNFDPNYWNKNCFELFKYLYDCYYKNTNRQLTNIWFFLKYNVGDTYVLKATKDEYGAFILKNYIKTISNFDKAQHKWSEKELPTLQDHRINFEENLKEITKHVKNT